jgi:hypothetical protein
LRVEVTPMPDEKVLRDKAGAVVRAGIRFFASWEFERRANR